jgi:hypothetical protein
MTVGVRSRIVALAAFAGATWTAPLHAQSIDLASASAQYMPGARMGSAPGKVQVSSYDVAVNVPVPVARDVLVVPGASYHVDAVSFAGTAPEFVDLRAFQSIDLSTLIVRRLPAGWSFASRVATGLAGDLQAVDGRMLRASTMATATHAFSSRFALGAGALTTFSFGSFLALPAVYVSWKPFRGAELETFLPAFAHARYTVRRRVRIGILAELGGNEYAVRDPRIRERSPCSGRPSDDPSTAADERVARPAECFDNLAYSVATAGVALGVRLVSTLWLTGLVGHSFFRRLDRRSSARELVPDGRDDIANAVVVRAGLAWRIPGVD